MKKLNNASYTNIGGSRKKRAQAREEDVALGLRILFTLPGHDYLYAANRHQAAKISAFPLALGQPVTALRALVASQQHSL